ncbi:hypothetical protein NDU88_001150 [Pleurodeles waltl]|uniref:Uncharacterized protein n=1 Tax=Pleurodeles waltl TaxID=8319 RepID=A0AAV7P657_PLEWA|nr:hypothetical protein NDU88_001150 [Pleurodeles waltl]
MSGCRPGLRSTDRAAWRTKYASPGRPAGSPVPYPEGCCDLEFFSAAQASLPRCASSNQLLAARLETGVLSALLTEHSYLPFWDISELKTRPSKKPFRHRAV